MRLAYASYIFPKFKNLTAAFSESAGRLMEEFTCEATIKIDGTYFKTPMEVGPVKNDKNKRIKSFKDMSSFFIRTATTLFPNTSVAVNRFHFAEHLNKKF